MSDFAKVLETLKQLPVSTLVNDVVKSVMAGKVTVLAAPTGSGKSMLVPAMLADATQEQVVVLVPRRFLATDAAKNVAQMAGSPIGTDVGYALSEMSGEKSAFTDKTRLLFVTYGYAISSGLISKAKNIVLDEVHESAQDISLARAILYERKKTDPSLRLLEMSATIRASQQASYWQPSEAEIHTVDGQTLACEERWQKPAKESPSIAETAIDLLTKEDRNGIAIFRSGIKDVEQTVEELQALIKTQHIPNVEVVQVYGRTPEDEREVARADPKPGWKKIIVGTNVIESGVNLRWVDAGISDGFGKIPHDRFDTGAEALVKQDLPQWRIVQQRGRINRDPARTGKSSGIFILQAKQPMESRMMQEEPELERCSLDSFAFKAASRGYVPDQLHLDAKVKPERWQESLDNLMRLGLVNADWSLTKDGKYVASMPLSPETGAMLCEAKRMDVAAMRSGDPALMQRPKLLPDAIVIAALTEMGGLRDDNRYGHRLDAISDIHGGSDIIDGMKAYLQLRNRTETKFVLDPVGTLAQENGAVTLEAARDKLKKACKAVNVHYRSFCDAMTLVDEIKSRQSDKKSIPDEPHSFDQAQYDALKQAVLNGNVNHLFQRNEEQGYRDLIRDYGKRRNDAGGLFNDYPINPYSAVGKAQETSHTPLLVGKLREFPGKGEGGEPNVVLNQVTSIPADVFVAFAAGRSETLLDKVEISDDQKELSARYANRAHFTLTLPPMTPELSQNLATLVDKSNQQDTGYWEGVARRQGPDRGIG